MIIRSLTTLENPFNSTKEIREWIARRNREVTVDVKQIPLSEIPVAMDARAKSTVVTEADLPEIKVADPVPQREQLFDGEDFLEKTDSFIGRMKWSIFREDK